MSTPRDLNSTNLRLIADWLDTYDQLAIAFYDMVDEQGLAAPARLEACRYASGGTEIQDDLRRWAAEMDVKAEMAGR